MKKKELLVGLGFPSDGVDEDEDYEISEDEDETENDAAVDEALDVVFDTGEDIETRREAFKRAVSLCMKG